MNSKIHSRFGPSIFALILTTFFYTFLTTSFVFAQCSQTINLDDITCSNNACTSTANCASTTFTASCTGIYSLSAVTSCSGGGDCSDFQACVNIVDDTHVNKNCHTADCNIGACTYDCSSFQNICLTVNQQYTLYVCLIGCPPGSCPVPTPSCKARGTIQFRSATTTCN